MEGQQAVDSFQDSCHILQEAGAEGSHRNRAGFLVAVVVEQPKCRSNAWVLVAMEARSMVVVEERLHSAKEAQMEIIAGVIHLENSSRA